MDDPINPSTTDQPAPAATSERREPWAWAFLAAVFVLLILLEVVGSFETAETPGSRLDSAESRLDAAVSIRESSRSMGALSGTQDSEVREMLEEVARDASKERSDSPRAARLYAAAQGELGLPVNQEDLKALRYSFSPSDQAIAEVYSEPKLGADEARSWARLIDGRSIVHRLARAQALARGGVQNPRAELTGMVRARLLLTAAFLVLLLGGLGVWIAYFASRSKGRLEPRGYPLNWISKGEADRLALIVGLFLLLMGVVHLALAMLLLIVAFSARFRLVPARVRVSSVMGDRKGLGGQLLWALGGLVANIPVLALALVAATALMPFLPEPSHPIVDTLRNDPSPATLFWVFVAAVVFAPIVEETVFRGMLMPAIGSVLRSPAWGVVLSSFLFASIHPQGIAAWLALGGVGAMCGMLAYHTRSLLPGMMLHALHNGALLALNLWINP